MATSSQDPGGDWIVLDSGGSIGQINWSPDSSYVLIAKGQAAGPGVAQSVGVFDSDGILVQSLQGADEAVWLDNQHVIITRWQRRAAPDSQWEVVRAPSGWPVGDSFLVALESDDVQELDVDLAGAISNGHGALAISGCGACDPDRSWHEQRVYQIWTLDGEPTKSLPGLPIAWSLEGDRLLIEHPLGDGPNRDSWPEIVSWPTLERVYADRDVRAELLLDPSWSRAAYGEDIRDKTVTVVDLATRDAATFATEHPSLGAWDAAGRLIMDDYSTASAAAYKVDGTVVAQWPGVGNTVTSSADGSTIAFYYFDQLEGPNVITILTGDAVRGLKAPGPISLGPGPVLSRDGSALIVEVLGEPTLLLHHL